MKDIKTERFVIDTISDFFEIEASEIRLASSFEDLEIDDLYLVELVMFLEDELEIRLNDSIYDTKTVGELIEQVIKQVN